MPGLRGFSGKSIRKMRQFYEAWCDLPFWPSLTAKLKMIGGDPESTRSAMGSTRTVTAIQPSATVESPYVEYAVRDYNKPLGVATYRTADGMPENLKHALPPIDELRKQLTRQEDIQL